MVEFLSHVLMMAVITISSFVTMLFIFPKITANVNWTWVFIGIVELFNERTRNSVMDTSSKWIRQSQFAMLCEITCEVITLTYLTIQWKNQ